MRKTPRDNFLILLIISCLAPCLALASNAAANPPTHVWSGAYGGMPDDDGRSVAVDGSGNIYVTGSFQGTIDFGGGPLASAGGRDVFLVKFDSAGNHIWSQRFGDSSLDDAICLAVDGSGNVYVAGEFWQMIDLGGGVLTSTDLSDIFLAKFDSNGNHVWSQRFGGVEGQSPASIALSPSADVYLTGFFLNTTDFGGGPITSAGFNDIFIAKFDTNGNHAWSEKFGDANHQGGSSLSVDNAGNVFLSAFFEGTVRTDTDTLISAGLGDIMVAKFASDGTHLWATRLGGTQDDRISRVAADGTGGVFVGGGFQGTVDFGGGNLVSAGYIDMFLARYDANGTHQWSQRYGDTSTDYVAGILEDGSGNVIVTALFTGVVDFGGGALTSATGGPMALMMYDANGAHQWSQNYGGAGSGPSANSIAQDGSGQITVTGGFAGSVDFGGGTLTSQAGRRDLFVAAFGPGTASGIRETPRINALVMRAYPNPFHPSVQLQFDLPSTDYVSLEIFDVRGRRVRSLASQTMPAGPHVLSWDGRDNAGHRAASGVYFARLRQGVTVGRTRLVLVE